jgi:hypothetical protein
MKLWRLVIFFLVTVPLYACGTSGEAISGRVLEDSSKKPIPGAIVVVNWSGIVAVIGHAHQVCVHTESAITDADGNYKINGWNKPSTVGPVSDLEPNVSSYRLGYVWPHVPSQEKNIDFLSPFNGTREERLQFLLRVSSGTSCPGAKSSTQNLYPMYKAMYEEAKNIAVTAEDQKIVAILRKEAARVAITPDDSESYLEWDKRVEEFMKDNLK